MLSPAGLTTAKVQRRKLFNIVSHAFRKEDVRIDKRFTGHLLCATGKWPWLQKLNKTWTFQKISPLYSIRHITLYVPDRLLRVDRPLLLQA